MNKKKKTIMAHKMSTQEPNDVISIYIFITPSTFLQSLLLLFLSPFTSLFSRL